MNPCLAWFVCLLFNKPSGQWLNKIIHDKLDIDKKRMVDKTFFFSVDSTHEWILWIYFKMHSHIKHCPTWEEEKMVYATTEILMKFCCIIYHAPVFFWRLIEEQMIVRGETVFFCCPKSMWLTTQAHYECVMILHSSYSNAINQSFDANNGNNNHWILWCKKTALRKEERN